MSFFDKICDITHTNLFIYVFDSGSNKVGLFVANVSKITTFNENVLDTEWALTSQTAAVVT